MHRSSGQRAALDDTRRRSRYSSAPPLAHALVASILLREVDAAGHWTKSAGRAISAPKWDVFLVGLQHLDFNARPPGTPMRMTRPESRLARVAGHGSSACARRRRGAKSSAS